MTTTLAIVHHQHRGMPFEICHSVNGTVSIKCVTARCATNASVSTILSTSTTCRCTSFTYVTASDRSMSTGPIFVKHSECALVQQLPHRIRQARCQLASQTLHRDVQQEHRRANWFLRW